MALGWTKQVRLFVGERLGEQAAELLEISPASGPLLWAVLALSAAVLLLLVLKLHRPGTTAAQSREPAQRTAAQPGERTQERTEEHKRRSRKRAGEKKLRNGLAVEPRDDVKSTDVQDPDPNELKADKNKKNKKKKLKTPAKETKPASERKEQDEAGAWETKVSHREKRQQRRKDKETGDESGSPGGVEPIASVSNTEQPIITPEEPKLTVPPTHTNNKNTTPTTKTVSSTKNTTRATSNNTPVPAAPRKEEPPAAEVPHALIPPVSPGWEEVQSVNGSGWRNLSVSAPVPLETWSSLSSERQDTHTSWPHDMEGSWTIVDGSHIPVSLTGLSTAVESQVVPDRTWLCDPVDDEWSGLNSGCCTDPASDWSAPCEEWGNYEFQPAGGTVSTHSPPAELQESDTEKDKDDPAAPGSSKAKKKKKKKKKPEDGGCAAQVEAEVGVAKDQNTAGNILPKTVKKKQECVTAAAAVQVSVKMTEPESSSRSSASSAQKKSEESWESPKQLKKKKARRET